MRCGRTDEQSRERCVSWRSKLKILAWPGSLRLPILALFADGFARATNDESLLGRSKILPRLQVPTFIKKFLERLHLTCTDNIQIYMLL